MIIICDNQNIFDIEKSVIIKISLDIKKSVLICDNLWTKKLSRQKSVDKKERYEKR